MAKIKLNGDTSGYIEISAPAVSGNNTLELGPGTRILTNLDNTFTGVSTFSSDVYLGNDIYLTDGSSGYERVEVDQNDIRVTGKHIHSQFGVWTRSSGVNNRRNGIDGDNNDLRLYSNSTEKVRINSAGNVGIASVTPAARLDVYKDFGGIGAGTYAGRVYGTDSGVNETGVRFVTKGTGDLHNASDAYLMHGISNGTTRFVFGANGNVGINETNPIGDLSITGANGSTMEFQPDVVSGTNRITNFNRSTSAYKAFRLDASQHEFLTSGSERLRIDSSGHLLHGVIADEDTSGNGGLRFINSGDIQIDGDQKALVFRSTNNTAQLQSAIEWWNENGAGVQSKISCDRTAVSQAPSDLVFYTSPNVDTGGTSSDGDITERVRIASDGNISIGVPGANTSGGWKVKLVVPDNSSYQSALNITNNVNADCQTEIKTNESRFGPSTNTPLVFKTNNTERIRITNVGRMGIDSAAPISKLQVGSHTFNGGNGMHSDDRVGMSNHGNLTGLMLASTYNDGAHPEYGLVFVQGPNTSSYNVWSVSPDGPAKGNSLNFHYDDQSTNIHAPGYRKFQMTGEGYFLQPHQPKFRVGRNGSYTPGAGSDIIFNIDSGGGKHNVGLHYNTSNGRFTAPVAGVYTFTIHVIWQDLSSGQNMADCFHPKINGTVVGYSGRRGEYIANETGNSGYYTDFNTFQFTLAANDYVTVNNQFNLTIHGNSNYTTFSGHLVG